MAFATRDVKASVQAIQTRFDRGLPSTFHNAKFDLHMLSNHGLVPNWKCIDDTLSMARLLNNLGDNKLKKLGEEILGVPADRADELKKWLAKNKRKFEKEHSRPITYLDAPDEILLPYASEDTVLTWRLHLNMMPRVNQALYQRELILLRLMYEAEEWGVKVDPDLVQSRLTQALNEKEVLDQKVRLLQGDADFNPDSDKDVIQWLYGDLGLTPVTYTPKGQPQVDEYNLLSNPHPATRLLVTRSKRNKSAEFLQSYLDLMDDRNIIHPTVNTMAARTHRFSCSTPNLQQIPARNDRFKIRECFISGGWWFAGADFAKQELYIAACEAGERNLMIDLAAGKEVYVDLAKVMLGKSAISSSERTAAKVAILAMLYGAGAPKVAESFTVNTGHPYTVEQAKVIRNNIKVGYPGLTRLMNSMQQQAMSQGFVTNRWGRKLYVQPERAYVATDYLVQSSGRDVLGDALIKVSQILPEWGGRLMWPIHDEVLVDLPEEPSPTFLKQFEDAMRCDVFDLPLTATPHYGKTLASLK